ncbi:unnamed protein product [Natator depressus]
MLEAQEQDGNMSRIQGGAVAGFTSDQSGAEPRPGDAADNKRYTEEAAEPQPEDV